MEWTSVPEAKKEEQEQEVVLSRPSSSATTTVVVANGDPPFRKVDDRMGNDIEMMRHKAEEEAKSSRKQAAMKRLKKKMWVVQASYKGSSKGEAVRKEDVKGSVLESVMMQVGNKKSICGTEQIKNPKGSTESQHPVLEEQRNITSGDTKRKHDDLERNVLVYGRMANKLLVNAVKRKIIHDNSILTMINWNTINRIEDYICIGKSQFEGYTL
ncbi:hypothetical protein L6452_42284 [Arctium lappa]|uniref:Uncharacterized protein n=1 Tax=Arctium lappa TaxID=4217 RepID=A0ACB8XHC3_ARCLA|nr:hypothetical protein L6452_42284 [Arctium lappa]